MIRVSRGHALMGAALALAAFLAVVARPVAQESGGALQNMNLKSDQPVKIESNALEVRDKQRQATFIGDVKLTQGETTLKCNTLVVFYEDSAQPAGAKKGAQPAQKAAAGPGGGNQQIKRAEARGNVFVSQKDQTASGDLGIYDLKANTITMTGNVVVAQGPSILRGERLVVDLTTGLTRVESSKGGGRVEMLTQPGSVKDPKAAAPAPAPPAPPPPPAAKAAPKAQTKTN